VSAILWRLGFDGGLVTMAGATLSLVFITLTAVVLIIDLERPERFYYILTRGNHRSWMVWGAYFLTAHGAISLAWLAAGWFGWTTALDMMVVPAVAVSILATSYTGFLFAQGLARDLWQGPAASIDLVFQSSAAGAATLLLVGLLMGPPAAAVLPALVVILAGSMIAHLVILAFEHLLSPSPTRHHELATETIRRGAYARLFWGGAVVAGGLLPVALLLTVGLTLPVVAAVAAVLALAGGAAWEYIWVEAGQSVPLS
jgi:formate-dependent nitrite reductase membrane component NrfD